MNPYNQAAFNFAQAYQMSMQAAENQRRANKPSTNAFAESMSDEENDYTYSPTPQAPAPPSEQYNGMGSDEGSILDQTNGNSLERAKRKVSKYLELGD